MWDEKFTISLPASKERDVLPQHNPADFPNVYHRPEDYNWDNLGNGSLIDKMLNSKNIIAFSAGVVAIAACAPVYGLTEEIKTRIGK